ncbi:HNH endonuclease signature motif containing protein [Kutzneria albida]|uniref:HNH endonuclease signature motif containing protein n=1 Tax=Kutzneria albida TaxID=43357 RepID=UPI0004B7CDC0|nr:HNH endonuclease signature motif containing protein [Kutzneria albida]
MEIARAILAAEAVKRSADHQQLRLIAELDDPHELALLSRIPPGMARLKLEQSAALARLPVLGELMRAGLLDLDRFEVVRKWTQNLDTTQAQTVGAGLAGAAELNSKELRAETEALKRSSAVSYQSMPDGMALLTAHLDAVPARAIFDQVDADAETLAEDGRTWGEKQVDVFVDRALGKGRPVTVRTDVTVSAKTLLGLTEEPGYIPGVGPVDAATAREIAAQGEWDRVCQVPGCTRPAMQCEIDHARGFASGGGTDACNLGPLCRMHHYLKTIGLYRFTREMDGVRHWTTPLGFVYTTRPRPIAEPEPP